MRAAILVLVLFAGVMSARGNGVLITSPNRARTFAYGEMIWHQLSVDPATHTLTARITFTNAPYAGDREQRIDESFDFRFPETHVDHATRTILVRDRRGQQITVARFRGNPTNGWVDLTSAAKIYLLKESGQVTALLNATIEPRPGLRWIQMDDNWSLQNLLMRFCKR